MQKSPAIKAQMGGDGEEKIWIVADAHENKYVNTKQNNCHGQDMIATVRPEYWSENFELRTTWEVL